MDLTQRRKDAEKLPKRSATGLRSQRVEGEESVGNLDASLPAEVLRAGTGRAPLPHPRWTGNDPPARAHHYDSPTPIPADAYLCVTAWWSWCPWSSW